MTFPEVQVTPYQELVHGSPFDDDHEALMAAEGSAQELLAASSALELEGGAGGRGEGEGGIGLGGGGGLGGSGGGGGIGQGEPMPDPMKSSLVSGMKGLVPH